MPICSNIFQFGSCADFSHCKSRHVFTELDKPLNVPCDGFVKFDIVGLRSPSHFIVKVLEYWPSGEKTWISRQEELSKAEEALTMLQVVMRTNCLIQVAVKTNDMCAVFWSKHVKWCRCKVLEKQ